MGAEVGGYCGKLVDLFVDFQCPRKFVKLDIVSPLVINSSVIVVFTSAFGLPGRDQYRLEVQAICEVQYSEYKTLLDFLLLS